MRPKALRELLALWLNVVTGRLLASTSIDFPDLTEATTVSDAIAEVEAAICDSDASRAELETAKDLAGALNEGASATQSQ